MYYIPTSPKNRSAILILIISFLSLIVLHGCAFERTVERTVKDNRLYISYPKVNIDVDKSFRYLGSSENITTDNNDYYFYFIPEKLAGQTLSKYILIRTNSNKIGLKMDSYNWSYHRVIDDKSKNLIKHEMKNNNRYESLVYITGSNSTSTTTQWLTKKGYMYSQCMLQQDIFAVGNSTSKDIMYFEDATLSGLNCNLWWDKYKYSEEQKKYVEEFIKRADQAVTINSF